jgi:hypothetical protein
MFHAPLGQTQKTGVFFGWNTLEGEGRKKKKVLGEIYNVRDDDAVCYR